MFTLDNGLLLPGVPNALTALIAADLGFDAVYLTGAGLTNTSLGLPDIGLISLPGVAANTAAVADAVDLPLVVDADTGFGNAIAVARTGACPGTRRGRRYPSWRTKSPLLGTTVTL